jgi:hypothetical protein
VRAAAKARESSDGPRAIEAAVEALAEGTEGFAAARMNRGIRDALAGKNVNDLRDTTMTIIKILPHARYCPDGKTIAARAGHLRVRGAAGQTASPSSTPAT